jgi:hypothetical protein
MGYPYPQQQFGPPQGPGYPGQLPSGAPRVITAALGGLFVIFAAIYTFAAIQYLSLFVEYSVTIGIVGFVIDVLLTVLALAGVIVLLVGGQAGGYLLSITGVAWVLWEVVLGPLIAGDDYGHYVAGYFTQLSPVDNSLIASAVALPMIVFGFLPATARYAKAKRALKTFGYPQQQMPPQGYPQPGYPQPGQPPYPPQAPYPPQQGGGYPPQSW